MNNSVLIFPIVCGSVISSRDTQLPKDGSDDAVDLNTTFFKEAQPLIEAAKGVFAVSLSEAGYVILSRAGQLV